MLSKMACNCNKMKVSFSSLLYVVMVALSLANAIHGFEIGADLPGAFSLTGATVESYKSFLYIIRQLLSYGTNRVYDIPVLTRSNLERKSYRVMLFTNTFNNRIGLAIDPVDLQIVGYLSKNDSYFFTDSPPSAIEYFIYNTNKNMLNFSRSLLSIELAAGTNRLNTPLGLAPLNSAIENLFHYRRELVPASLLVIIQMSCEALKFKFIEQSVVNSIRDGKEFTPGHAIVSLEDNWSTLSAYIQASLTLQGLFPNPIQLFNSKDEPILVDSIYYPIILPNIALQHQRCQPNGVKLIKMPGGIGDDVEDDDACQVHERTTWISGRDGLCLDAEGSGTGKSNITLRECTLKTEQQWTFQTDGSIRYLGKCIQQVIFTSSSSSINSVVLNNCSLSDPKDIIWKLSSDGTITNPSSGLALTAGSPNMKKIAKLTLETNTNISGQVFRLGDNVNPVVTSIMGYKEMCLEAISCSNYSHLWLEKCDKEKKDQEWALFNDGTIRVNSDRSLCVSVYSKSKLDLVIIDDCDGSGNQRWFFKTDSSIFNPYSGYVMDVRNHDIPIRQIILYQFKDASNQKWFPFY